jgi:DUF2959 family protein
VLTYKPIRTTLITAFCSLLITVPAVYAGATDDTFKESRELRKRAEKTFGEVNRYVSQLNETERALSLVGRSNNGNLRKRYESFSREVGKLEKAQARATSNIDRMRSTSAEYFSSWDKANAQIAEPELRLESARRRSRVLERHREFADDLSKIGLELQPFMSNLRDLKSFLGADLSPSNVEKARELIEQSQVDAKALKERIAGVRTTLEQFLKETPE